MVVFLKETNGHELTLGVVLDVIDVFKTENTDSDAHFSVCVNETVHLRCSFTQRLIFILYGIVVA